MTPADEGDAAARGRAEEIATACMAQRLGVGLLLNLTDDVNSPPDPSRDRAQSWAMSALTNLTDARPDQGGG